MYTLAFAASTDEDDPQQVVIPAQAGIHLDLARLMEEQKWIPAYAGMTTELEGLHSLQRSRPS
jgi:hypothetical protein